MLSRYENKVSVTVLPFVVILLMSNTVMAQSSNINMSEMSLQPDSPAPALIPRPRIKPIPNFPVRTMHRTGTAITGARNSISIKSTDAGIIHYPPVPSVPAPPQRPAPPFTSNCINCGIIDFVSRINQSNALNAMASGIIAATIAHKIGNHGGHSSTHPTHNGHHHNGHHHYQIGITMQDGSQQMITVPDASHLHRGDRVQFIDGVLIPEYTDQ